MKQTYSNPLKILCAILLAGVLLVVAIVCIYDILYFNPYRAQIENLLTKANPEDRNPPNNISLLIKIAHKKSPSAATIVARNLLFKLTNTSKKNMLTWHLSYAMWALLVRLHLPDDRISALYCVLAYNGQDYGANELSNRLFLKPLSQLSDKESATLIAILWSPSDYLQHHNDFTNRLSDELLTQLKKSKEVR